MVQKEILIHFFVSPFSEILQKVIWRVKNICSLETIIRYFEKNKMKLNKPKISVLSRWRFSKLRTKNTEKVFVMD